MIDWSNPGGRVALRVTYRIDGERIEVIDQERVEMVVPPSDELAAEANRSGFWYELQDSDGNPLYRRIINPNPMSRQLEIPTGNPGEPLVYEEVERPTGVFSIVVPDETEARSVAFFASRPESVDDLSRVPPGLLMHSRAFKAIEVAHFELHRER